jgi:hypothetical protein
MCFTVKAGTTLADLDRHRTGQITEGDIKFAIHKMRLMRRMVVFLSFLVLIFIISTFGAMYVAIILTREMHVKGGRLTDNEGRGISTSQHVDAIPGVQLAGLARRLSNASTNETLDSEYPTISNQDMLQIPKSYLVSTVASYSDGKINWVVALPDGTVRTVFIQGSDSETSAWGRCESCEGGYMWHVSCSPEASADAMCPISTVISDNGDEPNGRRLLSARRSLSEGRKDFLDQSGRTGTSRTIGSEADNGARARSDEHLDRALTGKGCV